MKFLILFPRFYFDHKMSPGRRHVATRLAGEGDVLSGVGWQSYRSDKPLRWNIERLAPDADAILWYKPLGSARDNIPALIEPKDRDIPAVERFNEAYWPDGLAEKLCRDAGTNLVIYHHRNDAEQFGDLDKFWLPHCAEPSLFIPARKPWNERTIPLLVTGVLSRDIYPLRTRIARLIVSGQLDGLVRTHPGYRLGSLQTCYRQEDDYAAQLGNAKVVVCCSSKYHYPLAKFVEAAMAGAFVVGDVPAEFEHTLGVHMGRISNDMTDEQLLKTLRQVVAHDGAIRYHAEMAAETAERDFTTERYCRLLRMTVESYLDYRRGEFAVSADG